uniref:VASP tetramerisation domain-containing protein n=1 Tax=Seriola lalandi dorsalis TaxID=1841481 RepID=A0A3B4Y109_SERLL
MTGAGGAAGAKSEARGNGPLPGGGGLMEEMSALLARRYYWKSTCFFCDDDYRKCFSYFFCVLSFSADMPRKPWERTNTMNGSKSPVIGRYVIYNFKNKNILYSAWSYINIPKSTPTPTASLSANGVPTEAVDYDRLKQDILDEMRKELSKLKEELIDAIREELGKSSTA